MPEKYEDIMVDNNGKLSIFNPQTRKMDYVATLGIVSSDGNTVMEPNLKQGCLEFSNVSMAQEFLEMVPKKEGHLMPTDSYLCCKTVLYHRLFHSLEEANK